MNDDQLIEAYLKAKEENERLRKEKLRLEMQIHTKLEEALRKKLEEKP